MNLRPSVPLSEFNAKAAAYLRIHREHPVTPFIANANTRVDALDAGGVLFPVTINDDERGNAWICSPSTTYADYAVEEAERLDARWIGALARPLLRGFGQWLRRGQIDRAVAINNWLVSTNSYPDLGEVCLDAVFDAARSRWPGHAFWFRSLNTRHHGDWLDALRARGCELLPSRQVYVFDDVAGAARERTDLKRDLGLLGRSTLTDLVYRDLNEQDFRRAAELYADLYVRKYSSLNPQYAPKLIDAWCAANLLQLQGVRDCHGVLQAIVGTLRFGNLLTSPIVGYDTRVPIRQGLYRLLAAAVLRKAIDEHCMVNLSAGVAHFKRQRGGEATLEYSAVFAAHLPRRTRKTLFWLGAAGRRIGVPLLERYKL